MANTSGSMKDKDNDTKSGMDDTSATSTGTQGSGSSTASGSTATGPTGNENWTGNEEKLYSGSGSAGRNDNVRPFGGSRGGSNTAEDLYQSTKEGISETVGNIADRARSMGSDVADRAKDFASNFSGRASDAAGQVTSAVKSNPMQSLLVGFGVGCLVGVLVSGAVRR